LDVSLPNTHAIAFMRMIVSEYIILPPIVVDVLLRMADKR
jgi:hypothetical protein